MRAWTVVVLLLGALALPAHAEWARERVDTLRWGGAAFMTLDDVDWPVLALGEGRVQVARYALPFDGSWEVETVVDDCARLHAVDWHDTTGVLVTHQLENDGADDELWIAAGHRADWRLEQVAVGPLLLARGVFDNAGDPIVARWTAAGLIVSRSSPGGWSESTVTTELPPGAPPLLAMVVDAGGEPALAYLDAGGGVSVARWVSGRWSVRPAVRPPIGPDERVIDLDLDLAPDGELGLAVTVQDGLVEQDLLHVQELSGGGWTSEVVATEDLGFLGNTDIEHVVSGEVVMSTVLGVIRGFPGAWMVVGRPELGFPSSAQWSDVTADGRLVESWRGRSFRSGTTASWRNVIGRLDAEGWEEEPLGDGWPVLLHDLVFTGDATHDGEPEILAALDFVGAPLATMLSRGDGGWGRDDLDPTLDGAGRAAVGGRGEMVLVGLGEDGDEIALRAPEGTWSVETLGSAPAFGRTAVLLDAAIQAGGTIHGVGIDGGELVLATRRDGSWTRELVSAGDVDLACLALDHAQRPLVVFQPADGSVAQLAHRRFAGWELASLDDAVLGGSTCAIEDLGEGTLVVLAERGGELVLLRSTPGGWDSAGLPELDPALPSSLTVDLGRRVTLAGGSAMDGRPVVLREGPVGFERDLTLPELTGPVRSRRAPDGRLAVATLSPCHEEVVLHFEQEGDVRLLRAVTDLAPGWRDTVFPFTDDTDLEADGFPIATTVPVAEEDATTTSGLVLYRVMGDADQAVPGRLRVSKDGDVVMLTHAD